MAGLASSTLGCRRAAKLRHTAAAGVRARVVGRWPPPPTDRPPCQRRQSTCPRAFSYCTALRVNCSAFDSVPNIDVPRTERRWLVYAGRPACGRGAIRSLVVIFMFAQQHNFVYSPPPFILDHIPHAHTATTLYARYASVISTAAHRNCYTISKSILESVICKSKASVVFQKASFTNRKRQSYFRKRQLDFRKCQFSADEKQIRCSQMIRTYKLRFFFRNTNQ